jgi:peptide/nickel transport system permease protein
MSLSTEQTPGAAVAYSVGPTPLGRLAASLVDAGRFIVSDSSLAIGIAMLVVLGFMITVGPSLVGHDPQAMGADVLAPPSAEHWFGTDSIGRDVLARLIVGARASLFIALVSTIGALAIGILIGVTAAYLGGMTDWIEMRVVDILLSMPPLVVAIAVLAALGPSVPTILLVLVVTYAPQCVRVVRASSLQVKDQGFVESAKISGLSPLAIMWRHIVPNIRGILIVQTTITVAHMLLVETILSFLGLGVPPPAPNIGFMLAEGRQWMELAPWTVLAPGCVVVLAVATFTFMGHGLDRALSKQN